MSANAGGQAATFLRGKFPSGPDLEMEALKVATGKQKVPYRQDGTVTRCAAQGKPPQR